MRQSHNAQASIFDFYAEHELAYRLRALSELLDEHPIILTLLERDFDRKELSDNDAYGLSLESIIRCLLLKQIHQQLMLHWTEEHTLSLDSLRIDSTVTESNIADPLDSQLLNDGVRVLSRMMATSQRTMGVKLRFTDQCKRSKSLSFQIFNAKNL